MNIPGIAYPYPVSYLIDIHVLCYQLLSPNALVFSTATFITRHLDLLEWRSKHLSVLAQTIPDLDMCRFGGIDALDRWYVAHHSRLMTVTQSRAPRAAITRVGRNMDGLLPGPRT